MAYTFAQVNNAYQVSTLFTDDSQDVIGKLLDYVGSLEDRIASLEKAQPQPPAAQPPGVRVTANGVVPMTELQTIIALLEQIEHCEECHVTQQHLTFKWAMDRLRAYEQLNASHEIATHGAIAELSCAINDAYRELNMGAPLVAQQTLKRYLAPESETK